MGQPLTHKWVSFQLAGVLLIIITNILNLILYTQAHGQLFDPPSRSSLWRFPEYVHLYPTDENVDYNDVGHYCGGVGVQYVENGGKCGVCGDPWNQPLPRDNEDGGKFALGVIVRNYTSGQMAPLKIYMDTAHFGYFEVRLCERNDLSTGLTQECLDKNLLTFGTPTKGTKYFIENANRLYFIETTIKIPNSIKCSHCVLQWHYRAANTWGDCGNETEAAGCGPQEIFRGCADVGVY